MSVEIVKVCDKKGKKLFVEFPFKLYKEHPNWVPPLMGDEYDTFNPKKNGAYLHSSSECYLAYKDGELVGRVAAIVNRKANELWNDRNVRFGWFDFVEDPDVVKVLLGAVARYGKEHQCETMIGPWGFSDMDKEGLLVEGFENLSPFTCLYNYPYYDTLLQEAGLEKDVDWVQRKIDLSSKELPAIYQYTDVLAQKFGIRMVKGKNMKEIGARYGKKLFKIYNDIFAPLFQFTPLNDTQIDQYLKTYIPIMDPKYVGICVNSEDNPIGFAFCVPMLSKAIKKCGGKLFPFGFVRVLKALKKNDTLEALMIGVLPEYQGTGAIMMILKYIHENCIANGITSLILNPQLEENFKAVSLFDHYDLEFYMRRRGYKGELSLFV